MTVPKTQYPRAVDTDNELFLVHDSLRLTLAEDWNPGDNYCIVYENDEVMSRFPPTGTITLVEQCSDIKRRAVGFYYSSRTSTSFEGLEVLDGYEHLHVKPKDYTHVVQSVCNLHHDNLKDALLAIEHFFGLKGTVSKTAGEGTVVERMNLLKSIAFSPRAWFTASPTMGLSPLSVTFTNQCIRVGPKRTIYTWHLGDDTKEVYEIDGKKGQDLVHEPFTHVYAEPGRYTVSLKAENEYGRDKVSFPGMIVVRTVAPQNAMVEFVPKRGQVLIRAGLPERGPYSTQTPIIRTPANVPIKLTIKHGENPDNPGYSYAGEKLGPDGKPIDPIEEYIWDIGDEIPHASSSSTDAVFGTGGQYDVRLTTETSLGSFRMTNYPASVDVVERRNVWLWTFDEAGGHVVANEFGMSNETFKSALSSYAVIRYPDFLDSYPNSEQAKQEFRRNTAFGPRSTLASGEKGTAMLFWAMGRQESQPDSEQGLATVDFEGFTDVYVEYEANHRPWNWAGLVSPTTAYFVLGCPEDTPVPNTNPTNQEVLAYDLATLSPSRRTLVASDYKNGADELVQNITSKYKDGIPKNGYFSVYRTCWRDGVGYILRNNNVGQYFEIRDFYRTEGILDEDFQYLTKLPSLMGPDKQEGQLVPMTDGVFFFNNSSNVSAYNPNTNTWETGGPSSASADFGAFQDVSAKGHASLSATLLATSDGDNVAYLSYDYSPKVFLRFDVLTLTFNSLPRRPGGEQFIMGAY